MPSRHRHLACCLVVSPLRLFDALPDPGEIFVKFLEASVWERRIFNGRWITAPVSAAIREPATGELLGQAGLGDVASVSLLATATAETQPQWGDAAPETRARVIREAARKLEDHAGEIAEWIVRETGSVQAKADFEIGLAMGELHQAAALATQPAGYVLPSASPERLNLAVRVPFGVVGVIAPWNFPLILGMRSVAPALALGNAVVLKPDPQTPVTGGVTIARVFQEAGLPEGLLSVIPGGADVGEAIVTHPTIRMLTFTGSSAVGRRVGELAGRHLKKAALELGGNNAMIVLDDCDIDAASSAGAWGSFLHQGQICMTTGRHIVMRSVAEQYAEALAERAKRLPVGDPFRDKSVALGPIISQRQIEKVHRIVSETVGAGAKVRTGGKYEKQFYQPTVLTDVTVEMPAFREEIFGPVAPITVVENEDEAVRVANATEYGLVAAVRTGSLDRGMAIARRLKTGMVHVNDQTVNNLAYAPFGGMGASGNGFRFGSLHNGEEFTEVRWITAGKQQLAYPF
jgi:benzaldehyde dehydrogenase (NAD)